MIVFDEPPTAVPTAVRNRRRSRRPDTNRGSFPSAAHEGDVVERIIGCRCLRERRYWRPIEHYDARERQYSASVTFRLPIGTTHTNRHAAIVGERSTSDRA